MTPAGGPYTVKGTGDMGSVGLGVVIITDKIAD
jgi:hypothetical protein